jgi:hypothetical protein
MVVEKLCSKCGIAVKLKMLPRGNSVVEVLLWLVPVINIFLLFIDRLPAYYFFLMFAVPATGYSVWRRKSRYSVCDKCNSPVDPGWQPTNNAAVTGLLFGLMFNIPIISGIIALIFGGIGIAKAKTTGGSGAGLSKLALLLGGLNIVIWLIVSVSLSLLWSTQAAPPMPPPPSHYTQ